MADRFFAQYSGPIRETRDEAVQDYDEIVDCLNKHRPDLVPLLLHRKVACKDTFFSDRG